MPEDFIESDSILHDRDAVGNSTRCNICISMLHIRIMRVFQGVFVTCCWLTVWGLSHRRVNGDGDASSVGSEVTKEEGSKLVPGNSRGAVEDECRGLD